MRYQMRIAAVLWMGVTVGLGSAHAQIEKEFPVTDDWLAQVRAAAPSAESAAHPGAKRRVLVLSLATGYQHWVIPHVEQTIKILGDKSGAYESVLSHDVGDLTAANLAQFDAVIFNNTCSDRVHRDLYRDVLVEQWEKRGKLFPEKSGEERLALAETMKNDLVAFVASGKGFVSIHGSTTTFINSPNFDLMQGGSFDKHLKQQQITYKVVDPAHPLMKGVPATGFTMVDEPYMYKGSYDKFDFHPLLAADPDSLAQKDEAYRSIPRYVSWIRAHDKGRVFQVSPAHNGSAYTDKGLLQFYLNGIQYALGDLPCDDKPSAPKQ